jgi:hypothetical protein
MNEKLDTWILEDFASINWGTRYMDWWFQRWMSVLYSQLRQTNCINASQGAKWKSPRMNGLSLKFYPTMWEYIKEDAFYVFKVMLLQKCIRDEQKTGALECRPIHETV